VNLSDFSDLYEARRIFDAELSADRKHMNFTEGCDNYYSVGLDKHQVGDLIAELQAMHAAMVE
jgi:hypothetical protein